MEKDILKPRPIEELETVWEIARKSKGKDVLGNKVPKFIIELTFPSGSKMLAYLETKNFGLPSAPFQGSLEIPMVGTTNKITDKLAQRNLLSLRKPISEYANQQELYTELGLTEYGNRTNYDFNVLYGPSSLSFLISRSTKPVVLNSVGDINEAIIFSGFLKNDLDIDLSPVSLKSL